MFCIWGSPEGLSADERGEYVQIKRKELEAMERRLIQKQANVDQHLETNLSMQAAVVATAQGGGLSPEEAQKMIERLVFVM